MDCARGDYATWNYACCPDISGSDLFLGLGDPFVGSACGKARRGASLHFQISNFSWETRLQSQLYV
jgi:hypothetical protein